MPSRRSMRRRGTRDATIKAADDLLTKFADTEFKEFALYMEAESYQQKKDPSKRSSTPSRP